MPTWQDKPKFDFSGNLTLDGKTYSYAFQAMHTGNCASCLLLNVYLRDPVNGALVKDKETVEKLCGALYEAKFKNGKGMPEHYSPGNWGYSVGAWIGVSTVNHNSDKIGADLSHTSDFFNWLIENKIGIVMASPVFSNAYMNAGGQMEAVHMNQAFYWIPPQSADKALRTTIDGTGGIFFGSDTTKYKVERKFAGVLNKRYVDNSQYAEAAKQWEKVQEAAVAKKAAPVKWSRKK